MKRIPQFLALLLLTLNLTAQQVSQDTKTIIGSIKALNQLSYNDIDMQGQSTPQYINYKKLLKTATLDELVILAGDTNQVVKGYVCLALLEKKSPAITTEYEKLVANKNSISSFDNGIVSTVYLYDFIRFKTYSLKESKTLNVKDKKYYETLYLKWDSIVIMNYEWKESDVLMDHIIETAQEENETISLRKRWIANSYFVHHIAKADDDYLYGTACGYPAIKPYLRNVMEKGLVDSNLDRVKYFDKWLSCDLLVIKVYGAEALIRLQNEGVALTPIQLKTIEELKVSYKSIQICSGYFKERTSIRRALAPYELK